MVGDAHLVQDDGRLGCLAILVDGFAVHLAGHENIAPLLGGEHRTAGLGGNGLWRRSWGNRPLRWRGGTLLGRQSRSGIGNLRKSQNGNEGNEKEPASEHPHLLIRPSRNRSLHSQAGDRLV